jgi:hypothetical protein
MVMVRKRTRRSGYCMQENTSVLLCYARQYISVVTQCLSAYVHVSMVMEWLLLNFCFPHLKIGDIIMKTTLEF